MESQDDRHLEGLGKRSQTIGRGEPGAGGRPKTRETGPETTEKPPNSNSH